MRLSLRTAAAVALALLAGQLSGCAGVPQDGPVTPAGPLAARPPQIVFASPPQPGDTPEGIVRGFLQAGSDFSQDHQVAREYLVPDARWRPEAPVLVALDDSIAVNDQSPTGAPAAGARPAVSPVPRVSPAPTAVRPDRRSGGRPEDGTTARVQVSARLGARVDNGGIRTTVTGPAARHSVTFTLVARQGEWRIKNPPAGLLLRDALFRNGFRSTPIYFPDAAGSVLVPDVRWFPVLSEPSATAALVVAALLGGPASWLGGAVTTGAAPRTSITAVAPVRIDGGIVRVDLSQPARDATPAQRVLLHSQLLATMQALEPLGLESVDDVVITQDQARYDVPAKAGPRVPAESSDPIERLDRYQTSRAQAPLCINNDHIGQLFPGGKEDGKVCPTRPQLDALAQPGIRLPAVDAGGTVFAVLAANGTQVLAAGLGKPADVVVRGAGLTAPSVDSVGWVWAVPAVPGPSFSVGGLNRSPARVAAPWLAGARVRSLRVSPEGARALVVLSAGGRDRVVVAGVRRDPGGRPLALEPEPLDLLPDATAVVDAGWKDPQQVVVLAVRPGTPAARRVYAWQVTVGGAIGYAVADPVARDAVGLAVGVDLADLFVRSARGTSYARGIGEWREINVRDPALPG